MPADLPTHADEVGCPDDGHGQAPPRLHDLDDVIAEFGIDLNDEANHDAR